MIRAIFSFLVFCLVVVIVGFFVKDKAGISQVENFDIDKFTGALTQYDFKKNDEVIKNIQKEINAIKPSSDKSKDTQVYFVKVAEDTNTKLSTTTTPKKESQTQSEKFRAAMEALFSGPSGIEKIAGVYSEIPPETKLLGIKEDANSFTINISDDFEFGGGAESMRVRIKQLVTTATQASGGKDVYLEINGKRAEYIGGEGIMILQPLQKNLK